MFWQRDVGQSTLYNYCFYSITDNSPPIETKYFSGIRLSTLEKIVKALNGI